MRKLAAILAMVLSTGCTSNGPETTLVLASTTSTQDSGVLDLLTASFETDHPETKVKTIAAGSGEALELGRSKDADVLLVHSPKHEADFMAGGFGISRRAVMRNEFIIVGPSSDPASASNSPTMREAFAKIAKARHPFVSRGDDSGTHRKELQLWNDAEIRPSGQWYLESGQGQAETLVIASEMDAYALTDSSTFEAISNIEDLKTLHIPGSPNLYSVIVVAGARNLAAAVSFSDWLTSSKGQAVIAEQRLFTAMRP